MLHCICHASDEHCTFKTILRMIKGLRAPSKNEVIKIATGRLDNCALSACSVSLVSRGSRSSGALVNNSISECPQQLPGEVQKVQNRQYSLQKDPQIFNLF